MIKKWEDRVVGNTQFVAQRENAKYKKKNTVDIQNVKKISIMLVVEFQSGGKKERKQGKNILNRY